MRRSRAPPPVVDSLPLRRVPIAMAKICEFTQNPMMAKRSKNTSWVALPPPLALPSAAVRKALGMPHGRPCWASCGPVWALSSAPACLANGRVGKYINGGNAGGRARGGRFLATSSRFPAAPRRWGGFWGRAVLGSLRARAAIPNPVRRFSRPQAFAFPLRKTCARLKCVTVCAGWVFF